MSNNTRPNKGKSLLTIPYEYVVVDIETTGLEPSNCHILEIGAIRCREGKEIERFSELIDPGVPIDPFITNLTGISNEMVIGARSEIEVLNDALEFIGDAIIVGHNVNFDINFIYDALIRYFNVPLSNDFVDTLRLSRRKLKQLSHHRLQDLAYYYSIDYSHAHRAVEDCDITNQVLNQLKIEA